MEYGHLADDFLLVRNSSLACDLQSCATTTANSRTEGAISLRVAPSGSAIHIRGKLAAFHVRSLAVSGWLSDFIPQ